MEQPHLPNANGAIIGYRNAKLVIQLELAVLVKMAT